MDIKSFENQLYNYLLENLKGKFDIDSCIELLKTENSSLLNYILSHAYYKQGDMINSKKYRDKAIQMNSNLDFESDYKNIQTYINMLFSTITTQKPPFKNNEIENFISNNPHAEAYLKASEAYRNNNDISNALRITNDGLTKFPNESSLTFDLASNLLYTRRIEEAWEYNERRFDFVRPKLPQFIDKPKFNLQKTSAKVYIYTVTRFGDTIFFARYLNKLKKDYPNLKLFFSPDGPLRTLFEENGIRTYTIPEKNMVDYQISIEGLPYLFKNESSKILSEGYFKANKNKSSEFKEKFFNNNKFNIGIVWNTSKQDNPRNIPIKNFEEIFNIENAQFYSLQKDMSLIDELNLAKYSIPNLGKHLKDFSDTAAAIDNLDLVIGCDTAVTNLSGAMGKNTIIALPNHADWRWGLFEENSEWYKSVKLYRQKLNQNYNEVFSRIKSYLINYINNKT